MPKAITPVGQAPNPMTGVPEDVYECSKCGKHKFAFQMKRANRERIASTCRDCNNKDRIGRFHEKRKLGNSELERFQFGTWRR